MNGWCVRGLAGGVVGCVGGSGEQILADVSGWRCSEAPPPFSRCHVTRVTSPDTAAVTFNSSGCNCYDYTVTGPLFFLSILMLLYVEIKKKLR